MLFTLNIQAEYTGSSFVLVYTSLYRVITWCIQLYTSLYSFMLVYASLYRVITWCIQLCTSLYSFILVYTSLCMQLYTGLYQFIQGYNGSSSLILYAGLNSFKLVQYLALYWCNSFILVYLYNVFRQDGKMTMPYLQQYPYHPHLIKKKEDKVVFRLEKCLFV